MSISQDGEVTIENGKIAVLFIILYLKFLKMFCSAKIFSRCRAQSSLFNNAEEKFWDETAHIKLRNPLTGIKIDDVTVLTWNAERGKTVKRQ